MVTSTSQQNRKKFKGALGGIIKIFKKFLHLKFHKTESEFVLWFQISKNFLSVKSDLIFGCVYIPPENSKYSNAEAFLELENELITLSNSVKSYVTLVGDFYGSLFLSSR